MTAQSQYNSALQHSASAIVEAMSDAVVITDDRWQIVYVNAGFTHLFNISIEEIVGKHLSTFGDFSAHALPATFDDLRSIGSWKSEQSLLLMSGVPRTISIALAPLPIQIQEGGGSYQALCIIRDISQQRLAEAKHTEMAMLNEVLLRSNEHFFVRTDMQGRFVFCNAGYLAFLGYSEQEIIGKHFDAVINEEGRQAAYDAFAELVNHQAISISIEVSQITADKKNVYVQWESSIVFDAQGSPMYIQSIGYDVTDRKLHEQMLGQYNLMLTEQIKEQTDVIYQKETAYSLVAQNMSDAIIVRDIQSQVLLFISPSIEHVLGYTQEEYQSMGFDDIAATGEDLWIVQHQYESMVSNGDVDLSQVPESSVRFQARKKNDDIVWLESRRQIIKRDNGAYAMMTILRDITRRVAVEEIAKQNEQKYRALMEYAGDAIFIADPTTGIIMEANRQAEILIGRSRHEIIGMHQSHLHPRTINGAEVFEEDKRYLNDHPQDIARKRTNVIKSDGTIVPVEIIASKVEFQGKILIQGLFRDISPQVRAEREIQEALRSEKIANELKSHFVTMASHQFRTPLTIIKANTSIIEDVVNKVVIDDKRTFTIVQNSFSRVYQEIERIILMMNDVMSLGRIEAGKILFQPEMVDMTSYLEDHLTRYKSLNDGDKSLALSVSFATGMAEYPVRLDRVLFTEVLSNLISNAFKYSQGKPPPEMHLHYGLEHIVLSIKDYGIGIPRQEYDKMFQNFSRAQNALHIPGTGLGLVIAKQFVLLHDGEISFESTLHKGTTFTVILPRGEVS